MENLKRASLVTVLFIMVLCAKVTFAQHDHGSHGGTHTTYVEQQPPHGGIVKKAGKYNIEMVAELFLREDQLRFYLFKGNYKTVLNERITGTIVIKSEDGTTTTELLQAKGDDFFVAQLKNSNSFKATVEFIIKGKTISTVFMHQGIGYNYSSTYSCPMHPEIESDISGTCPKCGMNLEKQ